MINPIICAACGEPITGDDLDERHWGHEPDCLRRYDTDACGGECGCDLEYHADCCPDCKEEPGEWEVLNHELLLECEGFPDEATAIRFAQVEMVTGNLPALIRRGDGDITALVWCGTVYRPEGYVPSSESAPVAAGVMGDSYTCHSEVIICPACDSVERATVLHTWPFYSYVHDCAECGYTIMESEWQKVPELTAN